MATTRTVITVATINQAKAAAAQKGRSPRARDDWPDIQNPGLVLRAEGKGVRWILKYKGLTRSLGKADDFSPKQARAAADGARKLLDAGVDPAPYLAGMKIGMKEEEALQRAREAAVPPEEKGWTWKQLSDRYIRDRISKPKKNGKPPSENTLKNLRSLFRNKGFEHINDRHVRDLTRGDLEKVRNHILEHSGGVLSNRSVSVMKAAFNWASGSHSGESGLGDTPPWWTQVREVFVETKKEAFLSVEQVGRLLAIWDAQRAAGLHTISTGVHWGLWWLALTGQRKTAGIEILKANIVPDEDAPGWRLAYFSAAEMKGPRDFVLPLPPRLVDIVDRIIEEDEEGLPTKRKRRVAHRPSPFLLPSRSKEKDGESRDLPINESAINQRLTALREQEPSPLNGLPHFTVHSLRHSLATTLANRGLPDICGSSILSHMSGDVGGNAWSRSNPDPNSHEEGAVITRRVYNHSHYLPQKRQGMEIWVDAVLEAYEAAKLELSEDAIMERQVA